MDNRNEVLLTTVFYTCDSNTLHRLMNTSPLS